MTRETIEFDVRGAPVPQGSARAFVKGGRAVVVTVGNSPLSAWRTAIATEARDAMTDADLGPFTGPVRVTLAFRFARPKSHYLPANRSRPVPVLRLDAAVYMSGAPDADKVARAGLDALTGVVYLDDGQVVDLTVRKRYVNENEGPGVRVNVHPLPLTA